MMKVKKRNPKVGALTIGEATKRRAITEAMSASAGEGPAGRGSKESINTILEGSENGRDLLRGIEIARKERARRLVGLRAMRDIQRVMNKARVNKGLSPMVPKKRK